MKNLGTNTLGKFVLQLCKKLTFYTVTILPTKIYTCSAYVSILKPSPFLSYYDIFDAETGYLLLRIIIHDIVQT